eukprot:jgi/Mesvir1/9026/Mv21310-RA.1
MTAEIKTVCEGGIVVHEPVSRLPRVYHDFALLLFCIFPFSVYPILGVLGSIYCARVYGEVFVFWATIASVASLSCPVIFTPSFRRVLQPLYSSFVFYQKRTRYVVPNKPFPPGRTYIFCAHPHGRMFYSFSMFLEMSSVWLRGIVPGYIFGAVNKTLFMLPFLRNWFDLLGLISASKPDLMRKLKQGGNAGLCQAGDGDQQRPGARILLRREWAVQARARVAAGHVAARQPLVPGGSAFLPRPLAPAHPLQAGATGGGG